MLPLSAMGEFSERHEAIKFAREYGKGWLDRIPEAQSPLASETCSSIIAGLYPGETVVLLTDEGLVFASHIEHGYGHIRQFSLPAANRSTIALASVGQTILYAKRMVEENPKWIFADFIPYSRTLWFRLHDSFCFFHPDGVYLDLFDNVEKCPRTGYGQPDEKAMLEDFEAAETLRGNYLGFLNSEMTGRLGPKAMQEYMDDLKEVLPH